MVVTVMAAVAMMAIPAKRGVTRTVALADGTKVELTLHGDEHYAYYKTAEDKPCQVVNGELKMLSSDEVTRTWTARKKANLDAAGISYSQPGAMRRVGTPSKATTGTQRGLVILMEFKDVKFTTQNTQTVFQRFFNEPGYSENGMSGSVRDYFLKQSYEKLTINFDVVGPYTTSEDMEYYGKPVRDDNGEVQRHDKNAVAMAAEAVDAAHNAGVNFSNYDWDNDGEVDQVFIIYAGYSEAQGADENTIWPHESRLSYEGLYKQRTYNNVLITTYGCAAELKGKSGSLLDGIGTACHEFSHCLGLPDMYDTSADGSAFGMGIWDVMDQGSYNGEYNAATGKYNDDLSGCIPAGYTSYERWFAGWLEPTELTTKTEIKDMKPLATTPEAYVLYNEKNRNEYYLLENRQPVDFDTSLYGHGLLILHVDYNQSAWASNTLNRVAAHQRMTIIPADNQLKYGLNEYAGDPWPGTSGNTALTNYTTPAATLFNANTDGTMLMSKPIDNITENVSAKTVSFVACREELQAPDVAEATGVEDGNTYTLTWPAVKDAIGYEVELTTTQKAAATPEEALVRTVDFSKCYKSPAGFSDISGSLASYGLTGWSGSKLYPTPNLLRLGTSTLAGSLKSPTWDVPSTSDITIVIGVNKANKDTKGSISITYRNKEDKISECPTQSFDFDVTGSSMKVFTFKDVRKALFWVEINASIQMYLNYMAIYDGEWTAEQLGIEAGAPSFRRAATINTYETATNSITLTGLSSDNKYTYRLRSLGESNTMSKWSDERSFEITAAAPSVIKGDANGDGVVNTKDLTAIVNKMLGMPDDSFSETAADVNGDGVINVSDIIGVLNLVLK